MAAAGRAFGVAAQAGQLFPSTDASRHEKDSAARSPRESPAAFHPRKPELGSPPGSPSHPLNMPSPRVLASLVVVAFLGLALLLGGLLGGRPLPSATAGAAPEAISQMQPKASAGGVRDPQASERSELDPATVAPQHAAEAPSNLPVLTPDMRAPEASGLEGLLRRLREEAENPKGFHARVIPVLDAIGGLLDRLTPTPEGLDAARDRLQEVVQTVEENPLVRGGAFLVLAPRLGVETFRAQFDDWLAPNSEHPLELVRAGALAAALRGEASNCPRALRIHLVLDLPGAEETELPGIYPIELVQRADSYTLAGIEAWLGASDPRREALERAPVLGPSTTEAPAPAAAGDYSQAELLDYWSTLALLYALWGHAGLEDSRIEGQILKDARPSMLRFSAKDVITMLPAVFLAQTLSPCNSRFEKLVGKLENSGNDLHRSIAETYAACGPDPLRISQLAKLEELRLSTDPFADSLTSSILFQWRKVAPQFALGSEQDQEIALRILAQAASNPEADLADRMMAWDCIDRTGSPRMLEAARIVCGPEMPELSFSRLLGRMQTFAEDPSLHARLREELSWMRSLALQPKRLEAVEALLSWLDSQGG